MSITGDEFIPADVETSGSNLDTQPEIVNWENFFHFDLSNLESSYTEEQIADIALRATSVLNDFESSDIGQFHLQHLQEKFEGERIMISFFDQVDEGYKDYSIYISINPNWGFLDQNTGHYQEMSFERMMVHEIIHAADPNISIGSVENSDDFNTMIEEYATLQTDEFSKQVRPEFGIRGAYGNAIEGGSQIINPDGTIGEKYTSQVNDLVETADERYNGAEANWRNYSNKFAPSL